MLKFLWGIFIWCFLGIALYKILPVVPAIFKNMFAPSSGSFNSDSEKAEYLYEVGVSFWNSPGGIPQCFYAAKRGKYAVMFRDRKRAKECWVEAARLGNQNARDMLEHTRGIF